MTDKITLYGMSSPNVGKCTIMLEELNLSYDLRYVEVFKGEQFTEAFLARNPNGKVPVLEVDGKDGKRTIFESGAILIYLAEQHGAFLPTAEPQRSEVLQWLMIQLCNIGPMLGQLTHFAFVAREGNDYAHGRYLREAERLFQLLDKRLTNHRYLAADAYSIADIATYPWTRETAKYGLGPERFPALSDWQHRLAERPGVKRGMDVLETLRVRDVSAFETASPEERETFFRPPARQPA